MRRAMAVPALFGLLFIFGIAVTGDRESTRCTCLKPPFRRLAGHDLLLNVVAVEVDVDFLIGAPSDPNLVALFDSEDALTRNLAILELDVDRSLLRSGRAAPTHADGEKQ